MQYIIKIESGLPSGYPMLLSNIQEINSDVKSINKDFLHSSDLTSMGYGIFLPTPKPTNLDLTKTYVESPTTEQDSAGNWLQKFVLEDIVFDTPEEKQAAVDATVANAEAGVRTERDELLAATDWSGNSDVTMASAMTTYRQALRDVPAQAGFPNTITWPTAP